jgi:hypothetical protein
VVIRDFHIFSALALPEKANAPLVIDPDAVLPLSVASERLKPVPGRNLKVFDIGGAVKDQEFSQCGSLDVTWNLPGTVPTENPFGLSVLERADHGYIVTLSVNNVKR